MAFFKSFQESLSSVSVSSILDTVSSTVSNTVDGVRTAVNDVTYTVSDQLTEQVNTIISKKQGEDEDKGKREEGEASSEAESRTGAAGRINSKRHAYIDEEEERREREKQEQDRRNEEEQWEWCYAPAKGWYRKRKDPNQKDTGEQRQAERQENKGMGTEVSGELSTSNRDVNSEKVMENNEGGQEDTISKTSAETAYCEDTGTEECLNSDNDQTHGHVQDGHAQDGHVRDRHAENQHVQDKAAQDGQNRDETQLDKRRNSTSTKPTQNTGGGAMESTNVERQLPMDGESEEDSGRSRGSSVLKDEQDEEHATGSQGHLEDTEVSGDKKETERSNTKDRFRRCTVL